MFASLLVIARKLSREYLLIIIENFHPRNEVRWTLKIFVTKFILCFKLLDTLESSLDFLLTFVTSSSFISRSFVNYVNIILTSNRLTLICFLLERIEQNLSEIFTKNSKGSSEC